MALSLIGVLMICGSLIALRAEAGPLRWTGVGLGCVGFLSGACIARVSVQRAAKEQSKTHPSSWVPPLALALTVVVALMPSEYKFLVLSLSGGTVLGIFLLIS